MLENVLIPASFVSMVLIVWFKTDAFVEYAELLGLSKVTFAEDFKEKKKADVMLEFPMYLVINKNCFISRLLSCPICFGFWLSLIFSYPFDPILIPGVYLISLTSFYLFNKITQ